MHFVALALLFVLLTNSGRCAAGRSDPKGGAQCSSFDNSTLLNPNATDPLYPCFYGQEISNSENRKCDKAREEGQINYYACQCLSKQAVQDLWKTHKEILLAVGGSLLAAGLVMAIVLKLRWKKCCLGNKVDYCGIFWAFIFPLTGLLVSGIVLLAIGNMIDGSEYWSSCG